jgi:CheY-like chemotaxis protein
MKQKTVLVVEDDQYMRRRIMRMFHDETSLRVIEAASIVDAADLLEDAHSRFDAVLCDIGFPSEARDFRRNLNDGLDLLVFAQRVRPDLRLYVLSVNSDEAVERDRAQHLGVSILGWFPKLALGSSLERFWSQIEKQLTDAVAVVAKVPSPTSAGEAKRGQWVFLSYCKEDRNAVRRLRQDLLKAGLNVWWDQDILGGKDWKCEIRRAMKKSQAAVVCLSENLTARLESGVYPEISEAITAYRKRPPGSAYLIPVRLSPCDIPDVEIDDTRTLDRLQCIDLFPEARRNEGLTRLLESLIVR